jgi:hypothetical protein
MNKLHLQHGVYWIPAKAHRVNPTTGTLTTEEWKAEQQLFLGQGEGQGEEPTHQRRVVDRAPASSSCQDTAFAPFAPHRGRGDEGEQHLRTAK